MIAAVIKKDLSRKIGVPRVITSEDQNDRYLTALYELDHQKDLSADEKNLAEVLTLLIVSYEKKQYALPDASPKEVLTELMAANNLRQKDLVPDVFGSESVISSILNGPNELNRGHIERLSRRFKVSPAVFFPSLQD